MTNHPEKTISLGDLRTPLSQIAWSPENVEPFSTPLKWAPDPFLIPVDPIMCSYRLDRLCEAHGLPHSDMIGKLIDAYEASGNDRSTVLASEAANEVNAPEVE